MASGIHVDLGDARVQERHRSRSDFRDKMRRFNEYRLLNKSVKQRGNYPICAEYANRRPLSIDHWSFDHRLASPVSPEGQSQPSQARGGQMTRLLYDHIHQPLAVGIEKYWSLDSTRKSKG